MAYLLMKRGKYMEGHSCCMGSYSFYWTADASQARRFSDDNPSLDFFCNTTGAKPVRVPNTRAELRSIGRERMRIRNAQHNPPSIHTKINRRAAAGARA